MVQRFYAEEMNRLLRSYLKKGWLAEFDRLASYSEVWKIQNDQTLIYLALRPCRRG